MKIYVCILYFYQNVLLLDIIDTIKLCIYIYIYIERERRMCVYVGLVVVISLD